MYHVSPKYHKGKSLYFKPKIPWQGEGIENETIKRICCSETIEGALEAIKGHCIAETMYRKYEKKDITGLILHVYQPFGKIEENNIVSNAQIVEKNYVPDAAYTKEFWILKPVPMKYIKSIEISEALMLDYEDRMHSWYTAHFHQGEINWENYYKDINWHPQQTKLVS